MKNKDIKTRKIIFLVLLILLLLPAAQHQLKFVKDKPLGGAVTKPEQKKFVLKNWFSGEQQEQEEKYFNEAFGFRSTFVRLNNQIAYSLFDKALANGVIIGKENYLYEENYIKAYYGRDFIGTDSIARRMQRLKDIKAALNKMNKDLILIFAAGKGTFYPEYFPDSYKSEKGITNYEYHTKLARELQLDYIDFNKYFAENKNKSEYLLYPKYGIHWSYYGMCLAADSILKYIENLKHIDLPNIYWNEIKLSRPKESDYDIGNGLNLLFQLKSEKMAYPVIQFESDSGKTKSSVLMVSDSFYWGMYSFGISKAFSNDHFWYYNVEIYPDPNNSHPNPNQVNLKDEIQKHDVFIIMATEATLPNFGWGFIENMYNELVVNKK